ncbi:hypothetical protein BN85314110 [Paracholeplasma brassicae]|uniref:Uncharacterized protein n=1 Tax=Acholeplasma brassicae TaxID=61635 RepID=U4KPQ3_9MOLU|nr:hypothetical protein [Paracholeplasma brassicae]CCV66432.1 hypothetical protein BN85314110 [Paracholeplasma brassicae]
MRGRQKIGTGQRRSQLFDEYMIDGKDMHIDFQTITNMAINGKDTSVRRLLSYVNENRAHFYIGLYY